MKKTILFTILIVGLFLVSGCSSSSSIGTTQAVPAPGFEDVEEMVVVDKTPTTEEAAETSKESSVREIIITAKNWEFIPNTIRVNEGDSVKLKITSIQGTHGFRLPDFGINERLEPGNTVEVEFVADKKGTFTFACSVPCGSGHGRMNGQLIVS